MIRKDSRSHLLDNEKCVENVGNMRFDLILVASEHLRELKRKHKGSDRYYTTVDALLDVQDNKVNVTECLSKVGSNKYQKNER
jgi:hypothetical protein